MKFLEENQKIIMGIVCIMIALFMLYMIVMMHSVATKPQVVNNYNIEHVDTVVIQESQEDKVQNVAPIVIPQAEETPKLSYSEMGYATPEFKYIPVKINNWVVNEDTQRKLYNKCKKYGINYIQTLAIMYKEGARNNQYAIHNNANGTQDIGLMQVNSGNTDVLRKITRSEDTAHLLNVDTNLECACYLIYRNENFIEEVKTTYDSLVVYNGGLKVLKKINSGEYTESCPASLYAGMVMNYMNKLYESYLSE